MKCRHCNSNMNSIFADLGSSPPSNSYLIGSELIAAEKWYPLRVGVCQECWLVQNFDCDYEEDFFNDNYAYFSSFSSSWLKHAETYVNMISSMLKLNKASQVIEVASNDGYLLQFFMNKNIPCYGVEPTKSTSKAAKAKGIEVVEDFFGEELARKLLKTKGQCDLMIANNVLAHVPDVNDFLRGFNLLLKPSGVITFEFQYLVTLVDSIQFDTLYHEHYSYFSLSSCQNTLNTNNLEIFDVEFLNSHGGSLRVYAQKKNFGKFKISQNVSDLLKKEKNLGVKNLTYYLNFQPKINVVKNNLITTLVDIYDQNCLVYGYGAAAKGNTILNYAGIKSDLLPYIIDKSPYKQNKFMPGSRIPIVNESFIKANKPEYILILPWNLRKEISADLEYIREWGGKFIVAVPEIEIF